MNMRLNFGQPVPESGFVLCAGLSPRVYESLNTLCCLATVNGPRQAHEIAFATGLPPAQTAKVLQLMTWAGFVESRRGTKGGFWLVKSAPRIRVAKVVAVSTHPAQFDQRKDPMLRALARATAHCRRQFSRITIADLVKLSADKTLQGPVRTKSKIRSRV